MSKIFLDFDYTLFDVEKFKDALYKAMCPYMDNKSKKFWQDEKRKIQGKRKGYDPKKHIALVVSKKDRRKAELAVNKTIKQAKKYLYPDTLEFFRKNKKNDLHIITFGFDKFQKEKIRATGLDKLAKVTITKGRKAAYFKNLFKKGSKEFIFIDDKGNEIDAAKTRHPKMVCYWMRRPGGKFLKMPCKKYDYKITNLKINL